MAQDNAKRSFLLLHETSINDATSPALLRLVERRCWKEKDNVKRSFLMLHGTSTNDATSSALLKLVERVE